MLEEVHQTDFLLTGAKIAEEVFSRELDCLVTCELTGNKNNLLYICNFPLLIIMNIFIFSYNSCCYGHIRRRVDENNPRTLTIYE